MTLLLLVRLGAGGRLRKVNRMLLVFPGNDQTLSDSFTRNLIYVSNWHSYSGMYDIISFIQ